MWDRAELKANAKKALSRYYWMGVLVCLLYSLLGGGGGGYAGANFSRSLDGYSEDPYMSQFIAEYAFIISIVTLIAFVLAIVLTFFVSNPLTVGLHRFFMESRTFKSDFSTLFYGFTGGRYMKNVKVMGLGSIKIMLWSLLLIIPGIIKEYEYSMIPYILAENPDLETARYFELSKQMTDGEKANIFVLGLSFVGWVLLGMLACCVGTIFVAPYIQATYAEFYALMRAKALAMGFSDTGELCDFLPPVMPNFGK